MEYSNCGNVLHEAFSNFCNKTENDRNLYDVYKSMFPYLKNINVCLKNINVLPIYINGNVNSGRLNIVFTLPNNVTLSIVKLQSTLSDNVVSFNIFKNEELLIADIINIDALVEYINKVQNK